MSTPIEGHVPLWDGDYPEEKVTMNAPMNNSADKVCELWCSTRQMSTIPLPCDCGSHAALSAEEFGITFYAEFLGILDGELPIGPSPAAIKYAEAYAAERTRRLVEALERLEFFFSDGDERDVERATEIRAALTVAKVQP
jgi:hypothetical protein